MKIQILIILYLVNTLLTNAQEVKHYYSNGQLQEEGVLINGKPIGEWKVYSENGELDAISHFDDKGKETGEWKKFHKGEIQNLEHYQNGKKDGVFNYYQYGLIELQETYNNGLLIGIREYYNNGNLRSLREFNSFGKNGEWQVCEEDGKLLFLEKWKNGKRNGSVRIYYTSYEKEIVLALKNDTIKAQASKCFNNSHLKSEGDLINRRKIGLWSNYYKNGQLKSKGEYIIEKDDNGSQKNGLWTTYKENGNIDEIGNYKKDIKTGKWKNYYKGKLSSVGKYKNGKATGKWKIYYSVGGYGFEKYKNGKKNGRTKQFYDNKMLKLTGKYKDGKKVGTWKWYSENGQHIKTKRFDKIGK